MKIADWGKIFRAGQKAVDDFLANKSRPASPPLTGAALEADLEELKAAIPVMQAWLAAHPGALTAADDLLAVLASEGFTWASPAQAGVDAAPGVVSEASAWLPRVISLLSAFQPAPSWHPGPTPFGLGR